MARDLSLGKGEPFEVENFLKNRLRPVQPSPVFVKQLNKKLTQRPPIIFGKRPMQKLYVVTALGLFLGLLIYWLLTLLLPKSKST